jgi:hypothetical protein
MHLAAGRGEGFFHHAPALWRAALAAGGQRRGSLCRHRLSHLPGFGGTDLGPEHCRWTHLAQNFWTGWPRRWARKPGCPLGELEPDPAQPYAALLESSSKQIVAYSDAQGGGISADELAARGAAQDRALAQRRWRSRQSCRLASGAHAAARGAFGVPLPEILFRGRAERGGKGRSFRRALALLASAGRTRLHPGIAAVDMAGPGGRPDNRRPVRRNGGRVPGRAALRGTPPSTRRKAAPFRPGDRTPGGAVGLGARDRRPRNGAAAAISAVLGRAGGNQEGGQRRRGTGAAPYGLSL